MTFSESFQDIVNVAAGSAVDTTYTVYVPVSDKQTISTQVDWTAGTAGTIAVKAYGTLHPFKDAQAAQDGDSGTVFQDASTAVVGAVSVTADAFILNKAVTDMTWLKYTVTITDKDDDTAYRVRVRSTAF